MNINYVPPSTRLRAVVFDLDGLMVNTEDLYELSGRELVRRRGLVMDDVLREQMMGRPAVAALQLMIDTLGMQETVDTLLVESEAVMRQLMAEQLCPMPALLPLLDDIENANLPKVVATSATREYAHYALARCGIEDRFKFVLTSEDVVNGKPAPDVYLLAAERLKIAANQAMVLEDSANGCRAALAAGAYTVAVPNRHTQAHDFAGVAFSADSLGDPRIRRALELS